MALDLRLKICATSDGMSMMVKPSDITIDVSKLGTQSQNNSLIETFAIDIDNTSKEVKEKEIVVVSNEVVNVDQRKEIFIEPVTSIPSISEFEANEMKKLFEYRWPPLGETALPSAGSNANGDWFVIQEILSDVLSIKSFKRRYPDLERHTVSGLEKNYILTQGWVSESTADLGLTAITSQAARQLLRNDFSQYYDLASSILQKHRDQLHAIHQLKLKEQAQAAKQERDTQRAIHARKKALISAAQYNRSLGAIRKRERSCFWDLQTMQIHGPVHKRLLLSAEATKCSAYPVALICGQYTDCLPSSWPRHILTSSKYTESIATDLRYLPLAKPTYALARRRPQRGPRLGHHPIQAVPTIQAPASLTPQDSLSEATVVMNCCVCSQSTNASESVTCSECRRTGHAICLELPVELIVAARRYAWQCMECKRCQECHDPGHEESLMVCDACDRGYHAFCVGLSDIPQGRWECQSCSGRPGNGSESSATQSKSPRK